MLDTFKHFTDTMENLILESKSYILIVVANILILISSLFALPMVFSTSVDVHTHPQQNGVAERKHRHIVEITLSLMCQSFLHLEYWPYAFDIAVFSYQSHAYSITQV